MVCLCLSQAILLLRAPPRGWIFACTAGFAPASRAVVLRLCGDLTCLLRICLYRRKGIEGEKRGGRKCQFKVVEEAGVPGRELPASRRLLTTFLLMDNHIGENLIELW